MESTAKKRLMFWLPNGFLKEQTHNLMTLLPGPTHLSLFTKVGMAALALAFRNSYYSRCPQIFCKMEGAVRPQGLWLTPLVNLLCCRRWVSLWEWAL